MLRQLLSIFRSDNPLKKMGEDFALMLKITYDTTMKAGKVFSGTSLTPEERTWIYEQDVQVNKLERKIRKQVIAYLSIQSSAPDLPYCLLLMSLVKDVERLGDYAKNISEIADIVDGPLVDDELCAEFQEIRHGVEAAFSSTSDVFERSDIERAMELTRQGQDLARRCDMLIEKIAHSCHDSNTVTSLVLGVRYYKRIGGHVLNILSGVTMPLHKVDYYDEDAVTGEHAISD
jgi:phosphate transport system protein